MVSENLKYLRKSKNQTQSIAAVNAGVGRTTWLNYESGKSSPKLDFLLQLTRNYGVSLTQLIYNDLKKEEQIPKTNHRATSTDLSIKNSEITLIPQTAQAGYLTGYRDSEYLDSLPILNLPNHQHGSFRAFTIGGDSMPPFNEGFIVIGKYVESGTDLKENHRYIFITQKEGITFKRFAGTEDERQNIILTSDNPDYAPFMVPTEDILEIWSFYSFIGYPEDYKSPWMELGQQVDRLTDKINRLTSRF